MLLQNIPGNTCVDFDVSKWIARLYILNLWPVLLVQNGDDASKEDISLA